MNKMLTFFKTRIKKILNKDIYFYNLAKVNLRKYNFTKVEKYEISTGYSIVETRSFIDYPINEINCILNSENGYIYVPVQKTPHFILIEEYLNLNKINKDSKNKYINYLNSFHKNIEPHKKLDSFIKLADDIKQDTSKVNLIIKKEVELLFKGPAKLIDGLHRLSILSSLGIINAKCFILDKEIK